MSLCNLELEAELLTRAMHSSYTAKEILGRNISALLSSKVNRLIGTVVVRYYTTHDSPLTKQTLTQALNTYIEQHYRGDKKLNSDIVDKIISRSLILLASDENDNIVDELDTYVKDTLTEAGLLAIVNQSTDNLTKRINKCISDIAELNVSGNVSDTVEVFDELDKKREIYQKDFSNQRITSGLIPFDDATGGGLFRGQIALFGASSGQGKSLTLTNLSYYYVMSGYNVMHLSLEELKGDMLLRFDHLITGLTNHDTFNSDGTIQTNYIDREEQFYQNFKQNHGHLFFKKGTPQSLTTDNVKQLILATEREYGCKVDVLVLDYADLLKSGNNGSNEAYDGDKLFQRLVDISQGQNLLLITATQLNRTSQNSDIKTLQSIEGSYRKINTVAFAATVNATPDERNAGFTRWYLDKVRNSYGSATAGDIIQFKLDKHTMCLRPENDSEKQAHQAILNSYPTQSGSGNKKVFSKQDKQMSMCEMINNAIANGSVIND